MTKFIGYYNLCPIHDPKEFLGIAKDANTSNIIVTLDKNIVLIIKISTQKQVRSWTMLEKLIAKVVYDHSRKKYVGVFANNVIRFWDENDSDISKFKKFKFQKSIIDLISCNEETYVLYVNGTCEKLSDAINSRELQTNEKENQKTLSKQNFTDSRITCFPNGKKILTYFEKTNDTDEVILVKLALGTEDTKQVRFSLKRTNMNVGLAGYAIIEGDDASMLLTIWSDKRLFLLKLTDSTMPETSPGDFVSILNSLDVSKPLSVLGISKHFVAIYGANSGQDGVSLLLYNTQFKVIKAAQYFKVYFNFSRLWAMENYILMAMGQNLSVVLYEMSKELLAELLGTQTSNDFQPLIEHTNEEDPLQENLRYMKKISDKSKNNLDICLNDNTIKYTKEKADGKMYPFVCVNAFESDVNALEKTHIYTSLETSTNVSLPKIILSINLNDDGNESNRMFQIIVDRLEHSGASELEITEKLMPILIKNSDNDNILMCIRRYSIISEKVLVSILNYTLDMLELSKNSTKTIKNKAKESQNMLLLRAILNCSFNKTILSEHIRHYVEYSKLILLFEYLHELFKSSETSWNSRVSNETVCIAYDMQILRWFSVCINTHFQKLALSKNSKLMKLLLKWHELFIDYKQEVHELEELIALFYNIVNGNRLNKCKNYSKWYNIEELTLY